MKTLQEIFGSGNLPSDFLPVEELYSKNYAFSSAQEYAEEYAKAFIMWYGRLPLESAENYIREFNHFKESLKK